MSYKEAYKEFMNITRIGTPAELQEMAFKAGYELMRVKLIYEVNKALNEGGVANCTFSNPERDFNPIYMEMIENKY